MHIGGQCANPLVYFVCVKIYDLEFGEFFQQITDFWKISITHKMQFIRTRLYKYICVYI
jgi:hypothetical protein